VARNSAGAPGNAKEEDEVREEYQLCGVGIDMGPLFRCCVCMRKRLRERKSKRERAKERVCVCLHLRLCMQIERGAGRCPCTRVCVYMCVYVSQSVHTHRCTFHRDYQLDTP